MAGPDAELRIEVVYARPSGADATRVRLRAPATLRDAIEASGVLQRNREIDLERQACGVFGRRRPLEAALADGDRVEIYRVLVLDPKEARRRRARRR